MPYSVDRVITEHTDDDQHFRGSVITSLTAHVGVVIALVVGPMIWPQAPPPLTYVPVSVMPPAPADPTPAAQPEEEAVEDVQEEDEPEAEPQPTPPPPAAEPEPDVAPRDPDEVRREEEAAAERERQAEIERERQAEAERQRQAQIERERQAELDRQRQAEEEEARRKAPQRASRRGATPQQQSGQRTGIDLTQAEDDTQGFTVEDFPFADYLGRIRDLIATRWSPPPRGPYSPQQRAEVFFRIGRDGRLVVQPRIVDASGESLFDRAALQAIAQAAPFPPLPRAYQGQSLGVGLAFVQE
ncbi:MAG: hypothetical protein GKS06_16150 [Acidobacteria bacterium]|nr:hypothetical protein [Acidobacteriota bacterium]